MRTSYAQRYAHSERHWASATFPGCTQSALLDAHHIQHWIHDGATSKHNLTLLCQFHHVCMHEGGFSATGNADGSLTFFGPGGSAIDPTPPTSPKRAH